MTKEEEAKIAELKDASDAAFKEYDKASRDAVSAAMATALFGYKAEFHFDRLDHDYDYSHHCLGAQYARVSVDMLLPDGKTEFGADFDMYLYLDGIKINVGSIGDFGRKDHPAQVDMMELIGGMFKNEKEIATVFASNYINLGVAEKQKAYYDASSAYSSFAEGVRAKDDKAAEDAVIATVVPGAVILDADTKEPVAKVIKACAKIVFVHPYWHNWQTGKAEVDESMTERWKMCRVVNVHQYVVQK
jgi:hypothetical protein